ncbi:glycosyltransferase [Mesonia aquimarina]|uniref:glycosyltransferase n=1 Tax=Mesonia aquimarina TaxID=1504967 RepID=UPI000EF60714|nr:glycosyltransferase [Mesonia aquimarina]
MKIYGATILLLCVAFILSYIYLPILAEIFLFLNLFLLIIIEFSRITIGQRSYLPTKKNVPNSLQPKVSIHISICMDSPKIVCNTIRSIVNQTYENYEVIILCHHTHDPRLWSPLKSYCNSLGHKVKFIQVKTIDGNKTGALNLCRKFTHPKTEYIFTLNGDYWLKHNAIEKIVKQMQSLQVDLLQFPRDYINMGSSTIGLQAEMDHHFKCYTAPFNFSYSSIPNGNLLLIKKKTLDAVGGWPYHYINEETQLGILLLEKGYTTYQCSEKIGKGMLPFTYTSLQIQRAKWIIGNLESLKFIWKDSFFSLRKKWESSIQLTGWINLLGLPFLALFTNCALSLMHLPVSSHISTIAISSIIFHLCLQYIVLGITTKLDFFRHNLGYYIHLGYIYLGAFCWWSYLFKKPKAFKKNNHSHFQKDYSICEPLFSLLLFGCGIIISSSSLLSGIILCGIAFLLLTAYLYLKLELKKSRENTYNSLYEPDIPT